MLFYFRKRKERCRDQGPGQVDKQCAWTKRQAQLLATVIGPWTPCSMFLCVAVVARDGGKPSWLRLDTSAGLENEVVFIFPCLGFLIYPVVAIYCPLSHGALKPLNVVSSRVGKSWLCTLIGVGLLLMGDSPETSMMPVRVLNSCQPLEVRPFIRRQITYLGG